MEKEKTITLDQHYIMIPVPCDAFKLKIEATLLDEDDEPYTVFTRVSTKDLIKARTDFVENIGDDWDAVYTLTEEGKEYLRQLQDNSLE